MPFDFLKRKKGEPGAEAAVPVEGAAAAAPTGSAARRGIPFDGLTEEWHIVGQMLVPGRLSDALNKREAIEITDVQWSPIDGSEPMVPAPGLKAVDPYDLIVVLASEGTRPALTDAEHAAYKIHKIAYDVEMEVPPFRVIGRVYLYPGSEPDRLMDRATEMFVPVVDATAYRGDQVLSETMDAILVNRFYLRGIEQIDIATGIKPPKLPGQPLGGTSWQERS